MNNPIDDPKLTAYALGELEGAEKAEVEARLAKDEEARKYVEEVKRLGGFLTKELGKESAPVLTPLQKKTIEKRAGKKEQHARVFTLKRILAVAAGFVILLVGAVLILPMFAASRERGRRSPPAAVMTSSSPWDYDDSGYILESPSPTSEDSSQFPDINRNAPPVDREQYDAIVENPFIRVADDPRSTFSIDVDTAAYALVRRFLMDYQLPVRGAVRIEELINYFDYDYAPPTDEHPFAVHCDVNAAPWNPKHRLVKIGLKGRVIDVDKRPMSNLVFLLDVSGSMESDDKLGLVKKSMQLLVDKLNENDRVAIVVYAGSAGLVLDSTSCDEKADIRRAIDRLSAGGSTAGGEGIKLAYKVARANFIEGGVNRVILCTDGDFNVGITSRSDLVDLIEKQAKSGVYLSVFGFGTGNYQDATMEELSNKGNGNYGYIDTINEARKAMVEQASGILVTIAKDVKIQIEFNPARVAAFRLIGYENRVLEHQDFNDDKKDAGDIGAGHTVTALYEVIPVGQEIDIPGVDSLKYQQPTTLTPAAETDELMTVKLRYKQPDGDTSTLMTVPVTDNGQGLERAGKDFKFASAVAMFGMILRDSKYKGDADMDDVIELASEGKGTDKHGYRAEFIDLAKKAKVLLEKD